MTANSVSRRWIAALVILLSLAAIIAAQLGPNRYRLEDDLTDRAAAALAAAGQPRVEVSFSGRDGLVTAVSSTDADQAEAVVATLTGVRTVHTRVLAAPAAAPAALPVSPESSAAHERLRQAAATTSAALAERRTQIAVQQRLATVPALTFHTGGAQLTDESRDALRKVAALLKANPGVRVRAEGHTDSRGPTTTNLSLSRDRATAVATALQGYDVSADRLASIGYGETRPAAPNDTAEHRATNRRVELTVH